MRALPRAFGVEFSSEVLLAAGTCGFGEPVVETIGVNAVAGLVTKSITLRPRKGNPAPRVVELAHGMVNSVGLANPGVLAVKEQRLPWMRKHLPKMHVFCSVAGSRDEEYVRVIRELDEEEGFLGYELNLSCPNDASKGPRPLCMDPGQPQGVVARARKATSRPLLAKLAPNDPDIGETALRAAEAGADGIVAVNTQPARAPASPGERSLGQGSGGMSGPALLPAGLEAVRRIAEQVDIPIVGAGGIFSAANARAYLANGAALVQVGSASLADPRCAARIARRLGAERSRP